MQRPTYSHRSPRTAFTLVEILVTITIIGILVGMLASAVIPAMNRATEAAIQFEMKQIELSIENFKNHYGFYPPSWVRITNSGTNSAVQSKAALLRYINRVSPNHQEADGAVGSRRIDAWWNEVGQYIDYQDGDDLVFWLSGLCKNKQYPLSGGAVVGSMPVAYDNATIERDGFFEFKKDQLDVHDKVAHYLQKAGVEAPFLFIDSESYGVNPGGFDGYHVLNQIAGSPGVRVYENPKTFQLICWGLDKSPGNSPSSNPTQWARQTSVGYDGLTDFADTFAGDNLCNFCDGRLDRFITGAFDSTAVQYQ